MAYAIHGAKCTGCGTCADECPTEAIAPAPGDGTFRINPVVCVNCGTCEAACPSGAPQAPAMARQRLMPQFS